LTHKDRPTGLDALFSPRSVAVVGASASPGKAGAAVMASLASFGGPVYPVNPGRPRINGQSAAASVSAIGEPVDLAVLVVPAAAVVDALEECAAAGVGAAVVCAGGFAESTRGEQRDGAALQERALDAVRSSGMRLLGPNTSGFMHPRIGLCANFVPSAGSLAPGSVSIVAQSGGVNLAACFMAGAEGLGIGLGVGLGNAADVGFADVLDWLAHHEDTRAIGLHIEGVVDGGALCAAIRRVVLERPVVALKVGRSDVADFARSHTGALLGDHRVAQTALSDAGAVVVNDLGDMVDALHALSLRRLPPRARPGVGVITAQAGPGLLIADSLGAAGVAVPELAPDTVASLSHLLPPLTWIANPVDTGRPSPEFAAVLAAVARDASVDALVVYALDEPDALDPVEAFESLGREVPAVFGSGGPPGALTERRRALSAIGVPLISAPERAARAVRALCSDASARHRLAQVSTDAPSLAGLVGAEPLDEHEAKAVLEGIGLRAPRRVPCATRADARAALGTLGGPVVVKVLDASILHKTDVGGVHVGVADETSLDRALDAIDAIEPRGSRRYLVEAQAPDGIDLIAGGRRDPTWGPVVLVGIGGVDVELHGDGVLAVAPTDTASARAMVDALPAALLAGYRGAPAVDRAGLAAALVSLSRLLADNPAIAEFDVNPLRLTGAGLLALDALIVIRAGSS
jgi:acetyltransferase